MFQKRSKFELLSFFQSRVPFYDQDLTVNTCEAYFGNRGTVDSGTCLQKPGISIDGSEFDSYCQIEAYDHMGYTVAFVGAGYRGSC
ncbi:hypothetical protein K4K49_005280 [Colletotrichum sp. SAR 10_70]|nr:hypothetical protein K4K50_004789 [Colletotrichum sp. SAR 10_71]KAI8167569.1 hypothetical protein K4K49_005280 [Colletotrichum sp. SAR 10_70]KAI8203243.1 hypothetical protein K4K52_005642 [Colletotrichum sp. SAR 10_76]